MPSVISRRVWRALQWAAGAAIIVLAARQVAGNWDRLRAEPVAWAIRPELIVLSALLVWMMYAVLVAAWRVMLASWGERLDGWSAARIWTVSSLGKYLPGKVWAIAGMAMMAQRAGVAPWAATGSAVILQALAVGSGAAVVAFTGAAALEAGHPGARAALLVLLVSSVAGVALLLWPAFVRRLLRLAGVTAAAGATPGIGAVVAGVAANLVAWIGYGLSLWVLAEGLLPSAGLTPILAIGGFTASYLAGLLFLLAPGGILVREGVFVVMLQGAIGPGNALALALASRLLLTVNEFGAAVPFILFPRETPRVAS